MVNVVKKHVLVAGPHLPNVLVGRVQGNDRDTFATRKENMTVQDTQHFSCVVAFSVSTMCFFRPYYVLKLLWRLEAGLFT
jgi:hypothetical protein